MLAALGLFVFEMRTFPFSDFSRRADWRHDRIDRAGARAASQYAGPGEDAIRLGGALVPAAGADYGAIETLRQMANEGQAHVFVEGTGTVRGAYVIVRMEEGRRGLLGDGTPQMVDFTLELERVE